jgi:hypothetical protein
MDYVPSLENLKRLRKATKLDKLPDQSALKALVSPLLEFLDIGEYVTAEQSDKV